MPAGFETAKVYFNEAAQRQIGKNELERLQEQN